MMFLSYQKKKYSTTNSVQPYSSIMTMYIRYVRRQGRKYVRGEGQTKIPKIYGRQRKGVEEGTTIFREGGWGRGEGGKIASLAPT